MSYHADSENTLKLILDLHTALLRIVSFQTYYKLAYTCSISDAAHAVHGVGDCPVQWLLTQLATTIRKLTHTFGDTVLWQDALSKYGYIELPLKVIPHTHSSCVVSLSCKQRQILVRRVLPKATIGGLPTSPTYTFLTTLCVVYMQSSLFMHGPYLKQTLHALPLCIV